MRMLCIGMCICMRLSVWSEICMCGVVGGGEEASYICLQRNEANINVC